eukprot:6210893-Pleurochrysis_carterae.AAC.1
MVVHVQLTQHAWRHVCAQDAVTSESSMRSLRRRNLYSSYSSYVPTFRHASTTKGDHELKSVVILCKSRLHDDVARRLVVGGDDLDAHLVDALSVVEVVLTRERRHQRREVPPVAQTLAFAEDALRTHATARWA